MYWACSEFLYFHKNVQGQKFLLVQSCSLSWTTMNLFLVGSKENFLFSKQLLAYTNVAFLF